MGDKEGKRVRTGKGKITFSGATCDGVCVVCVCHQSVQCVCSVCVSVCVSR